MGMDIYLRRDIANALQGLGSAEEAAVKSQEDEPTDFERGRREGFRAALVATGLSFGLGLMIRHWRGDGPTWIEVDGNE